MAETRPPAAPVPIVHSVPCTRGVRFSTLLMGLCTPCKISQVHAMRRAQQVGRGASAPSSRSRMRHAQELGNGLCGDGCPTWLALGQGLGQAVVVQPGPKPAGPDMRLLLPPPLRPHCLRWRVQHSRCAGDAAWVLGLVLWAGLQAVQQQQQQQQTRTPRTSIWWRHCLPPPLARVTLSTLATHLHIQPRLQLTNLDRWFGGEGSSAAGPWYRCCS